MAIIYTYPDLGSVDGTEKLLVSDGNDENNTKTITTAAYGAYINATYGGGSGSNIYQADGSIVANRQLSGSSLYSLTFTSLTGFTLDTTTNIALNPTTTVDIGEQKGITTANTTGDIQGIKDRNNANNNIYWDSRSLGTPGVDLILSAAQSIALRANNSVDGVSIFNGVSGKTIIDNGLVLLTGSGNDIADITQNKHLVTKEWVDDPTSGYIPNWTGSTNITTLGTITTGTWNGTAITEPYGGTGQSSYAVGDILYSDALNSLNKLTIGGANTVLVSSGTLPSWGGINNNYWSGAALSAANGGTGQAGGYTIGDILYADSVTTLAKLPAGATAGHVLTSNGAGVAPSYQVAPSATNIYTSSGTIGSNRLARITDKLTWQNGSIIRDVNSINIVEVTQESDFGTVSGGNINLVSDTTYIVRGNITCSNTLTVNGDNIAIIGYNRNLDKLIYTGTGNFINITDRDFTLRDLWLSATTTGSLLISGTNVIGAGPFNNGRDKVLEIVDCQFRNCFDVMDINGFDLVDISNTLFFYIQAPTIGLRFRDTSKLEISSCELIRWFDESTLPTPGGWATCSMVELRNNNLANFGAVNINGCIMHPQQTQNGIDIGTGSTTGFGTISSSAFVNTGLTTGKVFLPEIPVLLLPDYSQTATYNYDVFANQGILNSTSGSVSTLNNNTGVTPGATTAAPSSITIGGATPVQTQAAVRYSTVGTTGVTTYNGTKQIYCSIHASITINNNGNSDTWTVSLHKNGTLVPGSEQQIELSAGGPSALNTGVVSINYGTLFNNGDNIEIKIGSAGSSSCIIPDYQLVIRE
jgi:hypothetical protein